MRTRPTGQPGLFFFSANPNSATGLTKTGTRRFGIETAGVVIAENTEATNGTAFDNAAVQGCMTALPTAVCKPLEN